VSGQIGSLSEATWVTMNARPLVTNVTMTLRITRGTRGLIESGLNGEFIV
jgi:hypothetical protein